MLNNLKILARLEITPCKLTFTSHRMMMAFFFVRLVHDLFFIARTLFIVIVSSRLTDSYVGICPLVKTSTQGLRFLLGHHQENYCNDPSWCK